MWTGDGLGLKGRGELFLFKELVDVVGDFRDIEEMK